MRRAVVPRALLALTVALTTCGRSRPERITLGLPHQPALGLVFIAEANGYFAARGVQVEQRIFPTGRDALLALLRGEVDLAVAYDTPVLQAAPRAPDLAVLTTLHLSSHNTRVVARADRGIHAPADVRGKRIGVSRGTSGEFFLGIFLTDAGVRDDEVTAVDLPADRLVDAVAHGDVDAIVLWAPHADRAVGLLGAAAVELRTDVYLETSMLLGRGAHLARRPAVVRMLAALSDAARFARARPAEAFLALRTAFPDVPELDLVAQWSRIRPTLGVSNVLAAVLEREDEWLRANRQLDGPPLDLARLLRPEPLAEVEYEAVTWVSRETR